MTTPQLLDLRTTAPESRAGVNITTDPTAGGGSSQVKRAGAAYLLHALRRMVHALAVRGQNRDTPEHQPRTGPNGIVVRTITYGRIQGTTHLHLGDGAR